MQELEKSSILRVNYSPVFVQLIRKLGMQLPPPHYASFIANTLIMGVMFGTLWGVLMYLLVWKDQQLALNSMGVKVAISGLWFGLMMACYYKYSARKNQLTPWSDI